VKLWSRSSFGEALTSVDTDALKEEHASLYNLFGDPATRIRYPADATLSLGTTAPVVAGASFEVAIASSVKGGVVLVTLETERTFIRHKLVSPAALEKLPIDAALAAMADNHRKASDKVLQSVEAPVTAGRATARLTAPAKRGNYVIKAFVQASGDGESAVAMGHLRFAVAPSER